MDSHDSLRTSPTLLGRLRENPNDEDAWGRFVDRYGPKLLAWCRMWRVPPEDAEDVAQNVLLRLSQKLQSFVYDPSLSFRGWLRTLTKHAWSDFVASRKNEGLGSGDTQVIRLLETVEAREDLMNRLAEQFDQELLEEAMARTRLRVQPHNWDAFWLTAYDNLPAAEVADRLGIQVTAVFKARSRVQQMIREELAKLDGEGSVT